MKNCYQKLFLIKTEKKTFNSEKRFTGEYFNGEPSTKFVKKAKHNQGSM